MPNKHLVCHGALCKCQFGTVPDKLAVLTQSKIYINDEKGYEKLIATTMDLGPTFEKKTFGSCAMTNNSPCVPNIVIWDGFYDKVTLPNQGNPLLEDSMGTCAIGGAPCVEILFHGQVAEPTPANEKSTDEEIIPLINALGTKTDENDFYISLHE